MFISLLLNLCCTGTPRMSQEISDPSQRLLKQKLSWPERVLVALATVAIPIVFGVATWLVPDPNGYGTHQQLGLPACVFRSATGMNCPHCGMTTSFSWFVRGQWVQSYCSNPAGLLLAVICVCGWPWFVLVGLKGVWLLTSEPGRWLLFGFIGWLLLSFVFWLPRLFSHL